ncbi:MAG TPA: PHP domain-containing protein [Sedimentisphaerales bacterium]|nr:PHP domain-containing protein [Sedimentisphaerales bacterium]
MINVEMHAHTYYSHDGFTTVKSFIRWCKKRDLNCVCITDHNTLSGALEFSGKAPMKIIIGQEITTGQGDVTGLFLKEEIPPCLGLEDTIGWIKAQRGLVYLPHPLDEFRKSSVKIRDAERLRDSIDIIEVFNSRTLNPKYNARALEFAIANNMVVAVGSDAHHPLELGNSYMQMPDFDGPEEFLMSVRKARYVSRRCPLWLRFYLKGLKILTGKD